MGPILKAIQPLTKPFLRRLGLTLGLFGWGLVIISSANYLFGWDERFHALVALNLLEDPTITKLYPHNFISGIDYKQWYSAHIWLHKPPLFSYQMAFFMKIWGSAVWAMRFNSLVMLMVLFFSLRKMGQLLKMKPESANLIAFAFSISPIFFKLISGSLGMDHNDISFISYVAVSFYCLLRYWEKPSLGRALAVGFFVATAVLTKWLSGLLAFGVFGMWLIQNQPLKYWKHLLAAVTFSFALIAPWHLYTYLNYPQVYLREMSYNSLHFWETLESHQHPWHYHLEMWWQNFWPFILLFALIVGLILRSKPTGLPKPKLIALAVGVLFVHLFFGLAQTKLSAYSLIGLIPFLMILMLLLKPVEHLPLGRWGLRLTALLCTIGNLSWYINVDLANKHPDDALRAQYYRELKQKLPKKVVIFNAERFRFPEAMFYSNRLVYDFLPSEQNLQECAAHGYSPVVIVRDSSQFDFERYQALKLIPHYR